MFTTAAKLAAIAGLAAASIATAATVTRVETLPDGSVTEYYDNGDMRTTTPTGYVAYLSGQGWKRLTMPTGTTRTRAPGGWIYTRTPSGTLVIEAPDGSTTTKLADGTRIEYQVDKTVVTYYPDGKITTRYADGREETVDPNARIESSGPSSSGGDDDGGTTPPPTPPPTSGTIEPTVTPPPPAPTPSPSPSPEPTPIPNDAPVLVPGTGFSTSALQPAPVGPAGAPGRDAKAIARWDVVPYQDVDGIFEVGVVAFHMNGIDRVDFSLNGGPWLAADEMVLNPRTEVAEYWVNVDSASFSSSGLVEVRAIVYPTVGTPRMLGGPDDDSIASINGQHSLFLNIVGPEPEAPKVVWCSPNGSDSTGDGTRENPFRQPAIAAASITPADGVTVWLEAGEYAFGPKPFPRAKSTTRWITVEPGPGVAKDQVKLNKFEVGGFGGDAELIRFHNLCIVGSQIRFNGNRIWFDNCDVYGVRTEDYKLIAAAWVDKTYVTDTYITDSRNGLRGANFMRNVDYGVSSGSPFGNAQFVVNCSARDYDNSGTIGADGNPFHGGLFHWFPQNDHTENIIIYGVDARNFNAQGIMTEVMGDFKKLDNIAIVNFHHSKDLPSGTRSNYGSWWERDTDHLVMWNNAMLEQAIRWKLDYYQSTVRNVSIRGNVFRNFNYDRVDQMGFENVVIEDNHFTDLTEYKAYAAGSDFTTGDPMFRDPANGDYRPAPGSPLLNRLDTANTLYDINSLERTNSDIGPREGIN